jgi:hypothetical protein
MTWQYRVYHHQGGYTIREHYEDADGKCVGYTGPMEPIAFGEHTEVEGCDKEPPLDQLRWQLTNMLKALDKPILEDPSGPLYIRVTQEELLQAFGRAYCAQENSHKLVDFDLGSALCDELFGKTPE